MAGWKLTLSFLFYHSEPQSCKEVGVEWKASLAFSPPARRGHPVPSLTPPCPAPAHSQARGPPKAVTNLGCKLGSRKVQATSAVEFAFSFSLLADSARQVPEALSKVKAPDTAEQREAAGAEGAFLWCTDLGGQTCRPEPREPPRNPGWAGCIAQCLPVESGFCWMPESWIYSDKFNANDSQRNLVDSKNDKVEFIRLRLTCKWREINKILQIATHPIRILLITLASRASNSTSEYLDLQRHIKYF